MKRKMTYTEEQLKNLQKEHKELTSKQNLTSDDNGMLKQANENYRKVIVKNEAVLVKQTNELKDLKKITESSRNDADRLKEENEVLLKQNLSLTQDIKDQIQDPLKKLQADRANAQAIQDGKQLNP